LWFGNYPGLDVKIQLWMLNMGARRKPISFPLISCYSPPSAITCRLHTSSPCLCYISGVFASVQELTVPFPNAGRVSTKRAGVFTRGTVHLYRPSPVEVSSIFTRGIIHIYQRYHPSLPEVPSIFYQRYRSSLPEVSSIFTRGIVHLYQRYCPSLPEVLSVFQKRGI
jgi:hypothetical protein